MSRYPELQFLFISSCHDQILEDSTLWVSDGMSGPHQNILLMSAPL